LCHALAVLALRSPFKCISTEENPFPFVAIFREANKTRGKEKGDFGRKFRSLSVLSNARGDRCEGVGGGRLEEEEEAEHGKDVKRIRGDIFGN
jgi:hypothetical protein